MQTACGWENVSTIFIGNLGKSSVCGGLSIAMLIYQRDLNGIKSVNKLGIPTCHLSLLGACCDFWEVCGGTPLKNELEESHFAGTYFRVFYVGFLREYPVNHDIGIDDDSWPIWYVSDLRISPELWKTRSWCWKPIVGLSTAKKTQNTIFHPTTVHPPTHHYLSLSYF